MKVDEVNAWEAFIAVAKLQSFSKAATSLRLTPSQLSKKIAKLEDAIGARLFQRSTRSVALTLEGRELVPRVEAVLSELGTLEHLFTGKEVGSGKIRMTAAPFVAHRLLQPVIAKFLETYPGIQIELELSKALVDLIDCGYDMAIRVETPKDSNMVYRKLAPNHLVICASPIYLRRREDKLMHPRDLRKHDLLTLSIHSRCKFSGLSLSLGDVTDGKRLTCENGVFLTEMALAGAGILVRSIWDVQEHLSAGRLVKVLEKHPLEVFGHIHAVIPSNRYLSPRIRAFVDELVNHASSWRLESF